MSFWLRRKVFVTGASGLLGSHLVGKLIERGAEPVVLLRDWTPASDLLSSGRLEYCSVVRGELEDLGLLLRALNEHEIDSVFHLGAQTIVGTARRSPLSTFESNIRGTWNLLEACRLLGDAVERVVVASSDKAYGEQTELPYTEATPLEGRFPYDVSKSCADLIATSYGKTYGVPVAITRCGNLFGGGDLNFNRLVPGTILAALEGRGVEIRSDGLAVRDYFYVEDAADAYLTLAETMPLAGAAGCAFNFGNERPLSVLDMVKTILDVMGRPELEPRILDVARGEIRRQYLDCTKARETLGWKPRFGMEEGLRRTVAWYENWFGD
ncbi:MAG TPA: NAD-dependent epimerase/dehydratase family protein [Planctomycetes bacterium]|nr:NAD-dependent epimerase/dehydratase family protein [Planctomycetota bacterium]